MLDHSPVAWDASLESDVTNYRISYGTQSGVYADSDRLRLDKHRVRLGGV